MEELGGGGAHAACATGNECDFILQGIHWAISEHYSVASTTE
jgi:hypothetical protein